jgi:hypothetical protein
MLFEDIVFVSMFQYFQPAKVLFSGFLRCSVRKVAIVERKKTYTTKLEEKRKKIVPELRKGSFLALFFFFPYNF